MIALENENRTFELLRYRLEKKKEKLSNKSNQLIQTSVACEMYIDSVTDSALFWLDSGCTDTGGKQRAGLREIQTFAISLSKHTAKAVNMLRSAGPSSMLSSHLNPVTRKKLTGRLMFMTFDSDGRRNDYEVMLRYGSDVFICYYVLGYMK